MILCRKCSWCRRDGITYTIVGDIRWWSVSCPGSVLWVFHRRFLLGIVSLPIEEIRIDSLKANVSNASAILCGESCDLLQCISNGRMQEGEFACFRIPTQRLLHRAPASL